MQQTQLPRKQAKKNKRIKILIGILILCFLTINIFLINKILFFRKNNYISPISSAGLSSNSSFEKKLKNAKIDFKNLKVEGNLYKFEVLGEGQVIMTSQKNIDQQISSLQVIIRNLKIKGIRFKSLDFRYDKPVINEYE